MEAKEIKRLRELCVDYNDQNKLGNVRKLAEEARSALPQLLDEIEAMQAKLAEIQSILNNDEYFKWRKLELIDEVLQKLGGGDAV